MTLLYQSDLSMTLFYLFFQADLSSQLELGISLENFQVCRELVIPSGTRSYKVKLRLYDSAKRLLELYVRILCKLGGSLKV
jgi:vacuolar protein sorting-associated protein 13D